jgi:hypothetical protein
MVYTHKFAKNGDFILKRAQISTNIFRVQSRTLKSILCYVSIKRLQNILLFLGSVRRQTTKDIIGSSILTTGLIPFGIAGGLLKFNLLYTNMYVNTNGKLLG